jgi:ribulose-phosphate 3-epimerase
MVWTVKGDSFAILVPADYRRLRQRGAVSARSRTGWFGAVQVYGPALAPHRAFGHARPYADPVTPPIIAPSLLAADFARLADAADMVREDADWLHVDVMDYHYVPNLTIGLPVVESLRRASDLPLDCHLMIEAPQKWAPAYAEAGAYNVTFHAEVAEDPVGLAKTLHSAGSLAGLAIDRDTPVEPYLELLPHFDTLLIMTIKAGFGGQDFLPEMLDKVRAARRHAASGHLQLRIEVDGGIAEDTIAAAAEAGADAFVAGTAVYGADDPAEACRRLRTLVS